MKAKKMILSVLLLVAIFFLVPLYAQAQVTSGFQNVQVDRVGPFVGQGYTYIFVTGSTFPSTAFYFHPEIEKTGLAVGLTAMSVGAPVRVQIENVPNQFGFQRIGAIYLLPAE